MKYLTFFILSVLTASLVASLIGWSIATGYLFLILIAIPLGIIIILACRQHIDTIVMDDRTREIRSFAAHRALEIWVIFGVITAVILYASVISDPLSPKITGQYQTDDNGTRSMEITVYQSGLCGNPDSVIRSTTISEIDSMDEYEAMEYCQFRRESFRDNERKGTIGMTLGLSVAALLLLFGVFNLYYLRKY